MGGVGSRGGEGRRVGDEFGGKGGVVKMIMMMGLLLTVCGAILILSISRHQSQIYHNI